jgi:MYXO-CTERM domain-containing protein
MFELQSFSDYGLAQLQATTNVTDATTDFELNFEGCDVASECDLDSRIAYAQSVLAAYQDDPVASDAGSGATDAGGNVTSDATAPPITFADTGAPPGPDGGPGTGPDSGPGTGTSEDAGAATATTPATSQGGGGCGVSTTGPSSRAPAMVWLAALGLIVGLGRRRVRRGRSDR